MPTTVNFEERGTGLSHAVMTNKSSDRNEQRMLESRVKPRNKICSFEVNEDPKIKSPGSPDHHMGIQTIENKNSRSNMFYSGDSMSNS
jgi:hypothetical protein